MNVKCSNVIDLNTFSTSDLLKDTYFYLDTNIWLWMTYAGSSIEAQQPMYATFVSQINRISNAHLLYSHLTFSEITSVIESMMWDNYKHESPNNRHVRKKAFRGIAVERQNVVAEIETSINQISNIADPDDAFIEVLNYIEPNIFIQTLRNTLLDGTDILMAQMIKHNDVSNVVTDDKDFLGIDGINVFTFNQAAINEAKQQGINTNFLAM